MKRDQADNLPVVGSATSADLGARPNVDIAIDLAGNVILNRQGMSVAPGWRDIELSRIPKRLRPIMPGATGSNSTSCYTLGVGSFRQGVVSDGLELLPDSGQIRVTHGVIAPVKIVALAQYLMALTDTRANWQIDES